MPAPVVIAGALAKRVIWRRVRRLLLALLPLVGAAGLAVLLLVALISGSNQSAPQTSGTCTSDLMPNTGSLPGLSAEQASNARTIVAVGRQLGVPAYGWVIAVATAMQESSLVNMPTGDRDSVGLFQQRAAWGTTEERMDPATAARMFYTGGKGGQPGLVQVRAFEQLPLTQAAQAVQRSAFPNAYAKWQPLATQVVADPTVLSASCMTAAASTGGLGGKAVAAATAAVGTPYSWGGGTVSGPSPGFGSGAGVVGFDCSSLMQYAWHQAGVDLPRVATAQASAMPSLPLNPQSWRAGDLIFFHAPGDPAGFYHHVGMYDGQGGLVHAPRPGLTVEVVHDFLSVGFFRSELAAVGRPNAPSNVPPEQRAEAGAAHG